MPVMIELGTTKGNAIQLISYGVNRSVALKVVHEFEKIENHQELNIITWLKSLNTLPLKPIYLRYLRKLNLLNAH